MRTATPLPPDPDAEKMDLISGAHHAAISLMDAWTGGGVQKKGHYRQETAIGCTRPDVGSPVQDCPLTCA
ncbi:hypothetical protein [Komagataeibacter oboediens]